MIHAWRSSNRASPCWSASAVDFGLFVIAALFGRDEAETIQLAMEYAPAPPFASGTPREARPEILAAAKSRMAAPRKAREAIIEKVTGARAAS